MPPQVRAYITGGQPIDLGEAADLDGHGAAALFLGRDRSGKQLDLSCVWPLVRTMRSAVLTHEEQHVARYQQVRMLNQLEGMCSAGRSNAATGNLGYWLQATEDGRNVYFAVYVTEEVVGLLGMVVGRLAEGDETKERATLNRLLQAGSRRADSPFRRTISMLLARIGTRHPADPVLHSMLADIGQDAGVGRMLPIAAAPDEADAQSSASEDEEASPVLAAAAQARYHPYAPARKFASPHRRTY